MSAAWWACGRILAVLAFLAWLDDRGTILGAATQADVDTWLDGTTRYRYLPTTSRPSNTRADGKTERRARSGGARSTV